jgi:hypothetical protein
MALDNYVDLQAAVASWANRSDLPLADLINLAEVRMKADGQARGMEQDNSLVTVVNSRFVALPSLYLQPVQLWIEWSWGREALTNVAPGQMLTRTNSGRPYYWAIDNTNIEFERPSDQVYSLTLRSTLIFQLATQSTNYVLTNYPDVYLYGTLAQAALWAKDDEQFQRMNAAYEVAFDNFKRAEARSRTLAPLRTDDQLRRELPFNIFSGEPY